MSDASGLIWQYGELELAHLRSVDPVLGAEIDRRGFIRREVNPDLFAALVRAIVGQLISVSTADAIWGRLVDRVGLITPASIAALSPDELVACGFWAKKAANVRSIAIAVESGELALEALQRLPDQLVVEELITLPSVGRWTAEMLLFGSLQRPDVISWDDLGIRRGMMRLYQLAGLTKREFEQYRRRYSPFGSVAAIYLWAVSSDDTKVGKTPRD